MHVETARSEFSQGAFRRGLSTICITRSPISWLELRMLISPELSTQSITPLHLFITLSGFHQDRPGQK